MFPPRATSAVLLLLLLASLVPYGASDNDFGTLKVDAPYWQLITMPGTDTVGRMIFQVPGDVNGDGFDDLMAWRGTRDSDTGFVLFNGSSSGLDLARSWTSPPGRGVPGSLRDPGNPGALDSRPSSVDTDMDGRSDVVGWYDSGQTCSEDPQDPCFATRVDNAALVFGNAGFGLSYTNVTGGLPTGAPRPDALYLLAGVRSPWYASILAETTTPRDAQTARPAITHFVLYEVTNGLVKGPVQAWDAPEPQPLATTPRPWHFLAAPDFDGDRRADIVTVARVAPPAATFSPIELRIHNGTADGANISAPLELPLNSAEVAFGDFDADAHTDLAAVGDVAAPTGLPGDPYLPVEIRFWSPEGTFNSQSVSVELRGPSIFPNQMTVRLRAGDIDGDGKADIVTTHYNRTSDTAGQLRVDVFFNTLICTSAPDDVCDRSRGATAYLAPQFSNAIRLAGTDVYVEESGIRSNLQADYDGDGRRDVTVGYYGGNATHGGSTSTSGFVAVLLSSTVLRAHYQIWIDTDAGGFVFPAYRNYTLHIEGWHTTADSGTLRINITNLTPGLNVQIALRGAVTTSSSPSDLAIDGESQIGHGDGSDGSYWFASIPLRFNGSLPANRYFGLEARFVDSARDELATNPRAALFWPAVKIGGPLVAESQGRIVPESGWAKGGVPINFSGLTLSFNGWAGAPVTATNYEWVLLDGTGDTLGTYASGRLAASILLPSATHRNRSYSFGIVWTASPNPVVPFSFSVNIDADAPQYGGHAPLESEWITASPALLAIETFDNESGVDPARIEVSWENDGAPFVRWVRAQGFPGQTPGEVIGQALIDLPEGDLSNVIWRVWDKAGNGPVESPIFGVKVDTQTISFHDPNPPAEEWIGDQNDTASVWINAGTGGLNRSSVEYRSSTSGLFGFGPWKSVCPPQPPPAPGVEIRCGALHRFDPDWTLNASWGVGFSGSFEYAQGDANWIQWRAQNNGTSRYSVSDPYQIRFDSLPPIVSILSPDQDTLFPAVSLALKVSAREGGSRGMAQRGLDTTAGAATYRIQGPGSLNFGPAHPLRLEFAASDGWAAQFGGVLALERGPSIIEVSVGEMGGTTSTRHATVRVNLPPTVTVSYDPASFVVAINGTLVVTAAATDPEGGDLTYLWTTCDHPATPLGQSPSLTLSPSSPGPLGTVTAQSITLCVTVRDALDGGVELNVTAMVGTDNGRTPPPPAGPSVLTLPSDAGMALLLLLLAIAAAAALFLLRRRLRPPDKF